MTQTKCICEANPAMKCRFSRFRNPPFRWRVFLVAAVLAVPGALAGGMVSLFLGEFLVCSLAGALLSAIGGAVMEAGPPSTAPDPLDEPRRAFFDEPETAGVPTEKGRSGSAGKPGGGDRKTAGCLRLYPLSRSPRQAAPISPSYRG
jgi:hypothetical protein